MFNGALDQYCAALGAGAVRASDLLLSAGTTWVLLAITEKPLFSRSYIAPGRHPAGNLYGALASLTASGAALQWFKDNFMPEDFTIMNREAAARVARTEKLFFLPWQAGANYPVWESSARGVFAGLTLEHDRFDLARAIMEGVAFGVRRALEDFAENGVPIRQIRMLGGAAERPMDAHGGRGGGRKRGAARPVGGLRAGRSGHRGRGGGYFHGLWRGVRCHDPAGACHQGVAGGDSCRRRKISALYRPFPGDERVLSRVTKGRGLR